MVVLFGLILSVGLLVDGAVVVVEYAQRKIQEGMGLAESYIKLHQECHFQSWLQLLLL